MRNVSLEGLILWKHFYFLEKQHFIKVQVLSPGWCGSVD